MATTDPHDGEFRVRARRDLQNDKFVVVSAERFLEGAWVVLRTMRVGHTNMARLIADLSQLHAEREERMQTFFRDRAKRDRASQQRNEGIES